MSCYHIDKFIFELGEDSASVARLVQGDASLFASYGLTDDEQRALSNFEAKALYNRGVHPLLLMKLAILLKQDLRQHYY